MFGIKGKYIVITTLAAAVVLTTVVLGVYYGTKKGETEDVPPITGVPPAARTNFKAGIVTNGYECAEIGGNVLRKGGSAADAAIAALFCEGVTVPQSCGLGGGFLLTIYNRKTGKVETLNARETAPGKASVDMYHSNSTLAKKGALAVGVPGELRGYWELHKKYGKLSWAELIKPTVELCRKGHLVTKFLATAWKGKEEDILGEPSLREIYIDPSTNQTWKEGNYIKRLKLADTLEIIAKEGADALYNGTLTKGFVGDIQERGGIITEEDMHNYKVVWEKPIVAKLEDNMTVYTSPLPGSGVILTFILNILNGYLDKIDYTSITNWQRIVESFKFGYGRRTELGDSQFEGMDELVRNITSQDYAHAIRKLIYDNKTFQDPEYYGANFTSVEDHGTAHISVLAPNGDAVSVTTTINLVFGAILRSKTTGIILNDEMDDFSAPNITNNFHLPPSPANYIKPGKRPLSSMCPSIIVDKNNDVRLIVGAAGGSKITTAVASIIYKNLWFRMKLNDTINERRLHHQLFPMAIQFEDDFPQYVVSGLSKIGHKYQFVATSSGFAAVTAISSQNDTLYLQYDSTRRQGSVDFIDN